MPKSPTPNANPGRPLPHESVADRAPLEPETPDSRSTSEDASAATRGSVACKTAHEIPLGEFPLRVRWLPKPDERTYAFVPVFSESLCTEDAESAQVGLAPACVRACPTDALAFGDFANPQSEVAARAAHADSRKLEGPLANDLKESVVYRGLEDWVSGKLNRGAALDPRDEDPIYEQLPAKEIR